MDRQMPMVREEGEVERAGQMREVRGAFPEEQY